MSQNKISVCKNILKDHFGEVAETVGITVLKDNFCTLRFLASKIKFSVEQVLRNYFTNEYYCVVFFSASALVMY
jgi:hypothetical protein